MQNSQEQLVTDFEIFLCYAFCEIAIKRVNELIPKRKSCGEQRCW